MLAQRSRAAKKEKKADEETPPDMHARTHARTHAHIARTSKRTNPTQSNPIQPIHRKLPRTDKQTEDHIHWPTQLTMSASPPPRDL